MATSDSDDSSSGPKGRTSTGDADQSSDGSAQNGATRGKGNPPQPTGALLGQPLALGVLLVGVGFLLLPLLLISVGAPIPRSIMGILPCLGATVITYGFLGASGTVTAKSFTLGGSAAILGVFYYFIIWEDPRKDCPWNAPCPKGDSLIYLAIQLMREQEHTARHSRAIMRCIEVTVNNDEPARKIRVNPTGAVRVAEPARSDDEATHFLIPRKNDVHISISPILTPDCVAEIGVQEKTRSWSVSALWGEQRSTTTTVQDVKSGEDVVLEGQLVFVRVVLSKIPQIEAKRP